MTIAIGQRMVVDAQGSDKCALTVCYLLAPIAIEELPSAYTSN